jgi:hypothetical protein
MKKEMLRNEIAYYEKQLSEMTFEEKKKEDYEFGMIGNLRKAKRELEIEETQDKIQESDLENARNVN